MGKVDKFALFQGKLYSLYISLLVVCLLYIFEVLVGRLYVLTIYKEVKVVSKTYYSKSSVVLE